jgi:hypothetical protein
LNAQLKERNKVFDILNLDKLIENLTKFIELKLQIYELKAKEQLVLIISRIAILTLIFSFGLIMLFFFSMALAYFLNSQIESSFAGFAIVGGLYLTTGLILILSKDKLITNRLFQTFFSETITKDDEDHDQEE